MERGAAARRLIDAGEDPISMLLAVVWPGHDWAESASLAELTSCPVCSDERIQCSECGNTGLVTAVRHELLTIEALASYAYDAA
jgi:hypothetical protein